MTFEVGKTYEVRGVERECIFIHAGRAWLTYDNDVAYCWDAKTGKSLNLGSAYDITIPEPVQVVDGHWDIQCEEFYAATPTADDEIACRITYDPNQPKGQRFSIEETGE
jgi:hypothetical protein